MFAAVQQDSATHCEGEGKGVVAQGSLGPDGLFTATEVLAKHDENYMPPEAAEALHLVLTGEHLPVPLVNGHLGGAIYTDRVIVGREAIEIRGAGGSTFAAGFGLREYPATTWPGLYWPGCFSVQRIEAMSTLRMLSGRPALSKTSSAPMAPRIRSM